MLHTIWHGTCSAINKGRGGWESVLWGSGSGWASFDWWKAIILISVPCLFFFSSSLFDFFVVVVVWSFVFGLCVWAFLGFLVVCFFFLRGWFVLFCY